MIRIAGAVLAGGRSRRMGADKALVEVDGRPMAAHVIEALRATGVGPVVVVGGPPGGRPTLGIEQVDDRFPGDGPLGGVLTALDHFGSHASGVAVVACDLPFLDASVLDQLLSEFRRTTDVGAHTRSDVVIARGERLQPACAVWSSAAAPRLQTLFDGGVRALHAAVEALDARVVDVPAEVLRNINAPDDLPR